MSHSICFGSEVNAKMDSVNVLFEETEMNFHQSCFEGNLKRVKEFIHQNVSIYDGDNLLLTIQSKKKAVANLLLDVYERDLEALKGTKFNKALVAMPEDQTKELLETIETEATSHDVTPLLLKRNNTETPNCVYLRKFLIHKNDLSLNFARKLEEKNGVCDLNFQMFHFHPGSALHYAISNKMPEIVERLLTMHTIDINLVNSEGFSPLHFAVLYDDKKLAEKLSQNDPEVFMDLKFLSLSVELVFMQTRNLKSSMMEFVVGKMIETRKFTLKEILKIEMKPGGNKLMHLIAENRNYEYFVKHKLQLDEDDFCVANDDGDTILHIFMRDTSFDYELKMNILKELTEKYPKLTSIKNSSNFLLVHETMISDSDYEMMDMIFEKAVKHVKNKNLFYENIETAVKCLENASTLFQTEHSKVENLLQKIFNEKLKIVLETYGTRLLHSYISCSLENNVRFLLEQKLFKLNLNEFYEGKNAFLRQMGGMTGGFSNQVGIKLLQMLIDYQEIDNFNAADQNERTIFMFYCEFSEDNELIKSMILKSPDCVHKTTADNSTCFHFIHNNSNNHEICQILIESGANFNAVNDAGETPIVQAIKSSNVEMFLCLLELLKDEEFDMVCGKLLHAAAETSSETIIQKLLEQNVDISEKDENDNTPLHRFFRLSFYQISCLNFIKYRKTSFNINQQNNNGDTPIFITIQSDNFEATKAILDQFQDQIDFNVKNKSMETIIHKIAYSYRFHDFLSLFENNRKFLEAFNDHVNLKNRDGKKLLWSMINEYRWDRKPFFPTVINLLTLDNIKNSFHLFANYEEGLEEIFRKYPNFFGDEKTSVKLMISSVENIENEKSFEYLLTKIRNEVFVKVQKSDKNILHLICEKNNPAILDLTIKFVTQNQLLSLLNSFDNNQKTPYELLNEENQLLFKVLGYFCVKNQK